MTTDDPWGQPAQPGPSDPAGGGHPTPPGAPGSPGAGYPPPDYPTSPGQGYPPPPGQQSPAPARAGAGMATAALVLGILAIVTSLTVVGGVILGLLGIILGAVASSRAKRVRGPGRGRAVGGIVTGAIGLVIAVVLVVAGVSLLNSSSVKNLQTCLNNAGSNQAQVNACDNQFRNQVRHQFGQ